MNQLLGIGTNFNASTYGFGLLGDTEEQVAHDERFWRLEQAW